MAFKVDVSVSCKNFAQRYEDRMGELQNIIYLTPTQARYFGNFKGFEVDEAFPEKRLAFIDYVNSYVQNLFNEAKPQLRPSDLAAECKPFTKRDVKAIYYWALRTFDETFSRRDPLFALMDSWYDLCGSNPIECNVAREAIVDLCDQLDSSFFALEDKFFDFPARIFRIHLSELSNLVNKELDEKTVAMLSLAYSCIQRIDAENPRSEFLNFLERYVEDMRNIYAEDPSFCLEELQDICDLGARAFDQVLENAFLKEIECLENRIPDNRIDALVCFANKLMYNMKSDSVSCSICVPDNESNAAFFKNQFWGVDRRYGIVLKDWAINFFAHLFDVLSFVESDERSSIFHRFLDVFLMQMKIPYEKSSSRLFSMPCEGSKDVRAIYFYWLERVFEESIHGRSCFSKKIDMNVDDGRLSVENGGEVIYLIRELKGLPLDEKIGRFMAGIKGLSLDSKQELFIFDAFSDGLSRDPSLRK